MSLLKYGFLVEDLSESGIGMGGAWRAGSQAGSCRQSWYQARLVRVVVRDPEEHGASGLCSLSHLFFTTPSPGAVGLDLRGRDEKGNSGYLSLMERVCSGPALDWGLWWESGPRLGSELCFSHLR